MYILDQNESKRGKERERLTEGGNSMKIALEEEYSWQFMGVEESLKRCIVGSSGKEGEENNLKL